MLNYTDFDTHEANRACKLIDYYQDEQLCYVTKMLDGECQGYGKRHKWRERGIIPRSRNIVAPIVDKSAQLFNRPPALELWVANQSTPTVDDTLDSLMYSSDWIDFFTNVDHYTRLLKSTIVLVQKYVPDSIVAGTEYVYDQTRGDGLIWSLLHRGNSAVEMDPTGQYITALAYKIACCSDEEYDDSDDDGCWYYRLITPTLISEFCVNPGNLEPETLIYQTENVEGFVPAVFFYDGVKPFNEVWSEMPQSILDVQDRYNLFLTDSEYNSAWQMNPHLVTTSVPSSTQPQRSFDTNTNYVNRPSPYLDASIANTTPAPTIGGLGTVAQISLDANGNAPMFKFEGPTTDLSALADVINQLVIQVAQDWSVVLKTGGTGSASSGFQLIVEEMDNLNLREQRMASFQSAFRKLYSVLCKLYPQLPSGVLVIKFAPPSLPVNQKEQDDLWAAKIAGGRATLIDYYMQENGLTSTEAMQKLEEVIRLRQLMAANGLTT